MKLSVYLGILCGTIILQKTQSASCDTKFSESQYINNFGFSATTETSGNLASDVFKAGWCAGSTNSPSIDVDFKQAFGINGITLGSPTNQGNVFPKRVLVQYVPNGGTGFTDFPIGAAGKLEINLSHAGSVSTNFGGMSLVASKLRFVILDYEGSACLKIDLTGCESSDVCPGGCHNGGYCTMTDTCQCVGGFLGPNCQKKACTPQSLGLGDGRIKPDQITVSSEQPPHTKDQIGNSDAKIGWCPASTDSSPFVEVKLDEPKAVSVFDFNMIKRQTGEDNMFMREFDLQYIAATDSARQFRTFAHDIPAINGTHIFQVSIQPVVVTDTIRIVASRSWKRACFRLEISGCDPKALCAPNWCQNGGTCMGENVCVCPTNFFGSRCDQTTTDIVATNLTFVKIEHSVIVTTSTEVQFTVTGHVTLQTMDNKPVVTISGSNSYITLIATSTGSTCIQNINQEPNGYTFAMDINFVSIVDNTFIVSSGGNLPGHSGVALYYTHNQLHYVVSTSTQIWTLVVNYHPVLNVWQHFEITWNPNLGVELLVNGVSLGSNSRPSQQPTTNKVVDLCIACSHSTSVNANVNMHVTGVMCWPIDRTELVNAGVKEPPVTATTPHSKPTTAVATTASVVPSTLCTSTSVSPSPHMSTSTSLEPTPSTITASSPILTALTSSLWNNHGSSATTQYPHIQVTLEDAISVLCTGAGWNVSVDMNQLRFLYPSINETDVFLGHSNCQGQLLDELLVFHQRFDNGNCLTNKKTVNGIKYYENVLHYAILDPTDPTIVRLHEWSFTVGCFVSNSESTSGHFEHNVDIHNETYTVHHDLSIGFYKDPNFLHQYNAEPIRVKIGEKVYVKVFVARPDWNFKMRLHTCYTKPPGTHTTDFEHSLISDGCEVDSTTHFISQSSQETRFVFQDFQGVAMETGLDVYCNATFCDINDYTNECLQLCQRSPAIIG